ncbi:hypothetical protein GCM10020255_048120 [Rhodococcus baikonurensis]
MLGCILFHVLHEASAEAIARQVRRHHEATYLQCGSVGCAADGPDEPPPRRAVQTVDS